ncbi:MAG: O-antigen ligase family protein [Candidatus Woesebacteria bacterium]|jgi:hypothetical protein
MITSFFSIKNKKFQSFLSFIKVDANYLVLLLIVLSLLLVFGGFASFKVIVLLFAIAAFFLNLKIRDCSITSFLMAVFSSQFFTPNKYYAVEIIRGWDMLLPQYKDGYWQGYGVNISNVFWVLSLLMVLRDIWKNNNWQILTSFKKVSPVFLSLFIFFIIALGSSLKFSPFLDFSLVWLSQYMQILLASFITLYIFFAKRKKFPLLFVVIAAVIVFQFCISIWQFILQSGIGIPLESLHGGSFAMGLDENNAVHRVTGTLLFHNQLALVTLFLLSLYLPIVLIKQRKQDVLVMLMALIIIVLTQSRSIWIASFLVFLLIFKKYAKEILLMINKFSRKKFLLYLSLSLILLSYVIIPRVLLSFNAFYEGAGIPIRKRLLEEGIDVLVRNPSFGYGVGTNEYTLHSFFPNGVMTVFPTVVHMASVQLAIEVGLLGLFFFLFPFFYIFRQHYTNQGSRKASKASLRNLKKNQYFLSYVLGCIVFFIYYLFLPHVGIVEFQYLGIVLGLGLISISGK